MADTIYFEPKRVWDLDGAFDLMLKQGVAKTRKTAERRLYDLAILPGLIDIESIHDEAGRSLNRLLLDDEMKRARRQRSRLLFAQLYTHNKQSSIHLHDTRGVRWWVPLHEAHQAWCSDDIQAALSLVAQHINKPITLIAHGELVRQLRQLPPIEGLRYNIHLYRPTLVLKESQPCKQALSPHLARLEAEAIHIIREAVADAERPVMLYSLGKDSSVMLHLARKAFYPGTPPFPLMHIDTRWKFQEMYLFRDHMAKTCGMDLIVHTNPEAVKKNINPFDHGSALHTDITKTQGLKQALDKHRFDVIFGGARRDEEKSRAKERIFSFRNEHHAWDPKQQRPELWNLYNTRKNRGESIRVFPLSNWTELDIWQYIHQQQIPIVPLYFAKARPVVERDGMLMMVDDERFRLEPGDVIRERMVRFRTLGCYPLTGAVESTAASVSEIILELVQARESERQGRAIDHDSSASMEKKKQAGYF